MEAQQHDERHESNTQTEPSASAAEQAAFTPPFASEGLERVRDSHC